MKSFIAFGSCITVGVLASQGCRSRVIDPLHCANNDGDAYCGAEFPDGSRPYCRRGISECMDIGDPQLGCVAEVPVEDECYSPCGGRMNVLENSECLSGEESSSSGSSEDSGSSSESTESGSSSTTGPMPCVSNEECVTPERPYCADDGVCVGCGEAPEAGLGDMACLAQSEQMPLCVDNACVACAEGDTAVCDDALLVCAVDVNECVECREHGECGAGACDIEDGRCFDPGHVLDVGTDRTYPTIAEALQAAEEMVLDPVVLRLYGPESFDETATIASGVVAFVAGEGESPQWINSSEMAPTLTVTGAETRVYVDGIRLRDGDTALSVTGAHVDIRGSELASNDVRGLTCTGEEAQVDVRGSRVVQNSGGGILVGNGCRLYVENSFVGGDASDTDTLVVESGNVEVLYSTIVAGSGLGDSRAVFCSPRAAVSVRNSVLVAVDDGNPEVVCDQAEITYSATEESVLGMGNVMLGPLQLGWLNDLSSDFHLGDMAPIELSTTARWQDGDPVVDIDGDPRPAVAGMPDYAGADALP